MSSIIGEGRSRQDKKIMRILFGFDLSKKENQNLGRGSDNSANQLKILKPTKLLLFIFNPYFRMIVSIGAS